MKKDQHLPPISIILQALKWSWLKAVAIRWGTALEMILRDEVPVHKVCVDDFYLGKYEVTQGQWLKIMVGNPAAFKNGDGFPIENISWHDAQEFIRELNQRTGQKYRLPTEAEWEFAARSGGKIERWAGTSNESDLGAFAWFEQNSGGTTHPVGEKRPNGIGIYDMSGNVWEWVQDTYKDDAYKQHSRHNPIITVGSSDHVFRGGSFFFSPTSIVAANRGGKSNFFSYNQFVVGFRLAGPN